MALAVIGSTKDSTMSLNASRPVLMCPETHDGWCKRTLLSFLCSFLLKPRAPRCFGMWPRSSSVLSKELKLFCGSQLPGHIYPAEYKHAKGFWNMNFKSNSLIITHVVDSNYPSICWLSLSNVIHNSVSLLMPVGISSAYLSVFLVPVYPPIVG